MYWLVILKETSLTSLRAKGVKQMANRLPLAVVRKGQAE